MRMLKHKKGEWREERSMRIEKRVEWTAYTFPMFIHEYMTNVTPTHLQPEEWEIMLHEYMPKYTLLLCIFLKNKRVPRMGDTEVHCRVMFHKLSLYSNWTEKLRQEPSRGNLAATVAQKIRDQSTLCHNIPVGARWPRMFLEKCEWHRHREDYT